MTTDKKRLLKAKISLALLDELGHSQRRPKEKSLPPPPVSSHQAPHHHCSLDAAICEIHKLGAGHARTTTAQERPTATMIAASFQSLVARAPASDAERRAHDVLFATYHAAERRAAPPLPHYQRSFSASTTLAHTP
jgi:hypothetical protein